VLRLRTLIHVVSSVAHGYPELAALEIPTAEWIGENFLVGCKSLEFIDLRATRA
jgi:hypothetical protein